MKIPSRQSLGSTRILGLSLVELMVCLVLGVLFSAAVVSAYLGAKRSYFYDEQMARMQENGRYALRLLSRELALAGFFGGVPTLSGVAPAPVGTDCSSERWALDGRDPVDLVNDYAGEPPPVSLRMLPLTCLDGAAVVPDTDLLVIKRTAAQASLYLGAPAVTLTPATSESWFLRTESGSPSGWEKLRPIDLYDAGRASPTRSYWEAITRIFYVRSYSESGSEGEDLPTLCMETLAGDAMTSRCLVEGVESMQLEFGVDSDDDGAPNQYLAAPGAGEMRQVVAVKIHLLLRSIATLTGHRDDKTYRLGQKVLPARGDSHLRRVFSSTVLLRNKIQPIG